jgi:hypothetical protein
MKAVTRLTFALLSAMAVVVLLMIAIAGCNRSTRLSQPSISIPAKQDVIERKSLGGSCTVTIDQQTGKKQYECTLPNDNEKDQGR